VVAVKKTVEAEFFTSRITLALAASRITLALAALGGIDFQLQSI
jgi:hypothetical protein